MHKIKSIAELLETGQVAIMGFAVDLQGWNSDHPVFDRLVEETQPETIIEVGTWKGRSAKHLAEASKARIYCVDTWLGGIDHVMSEKPVDDLKCDLAGSPQLYHQFLRNFQEEPEIAARIHPIQNTSTNGARLLAHCNVQAELIYIDGSHEYADVYADLVAYAQLLKPGGVLFGDDFRSFPGVFAAVLRFAYESGRKVEEVAGNYWILREA